MSEPMLPTKDNESVSSNTESTSCEYGDELPESGSDSLNSLIKEKRVSCADNCILDCSIVQECTSSCEDQKSRRRSFCCNTIAQCAWGVILLLGSIIGFIFTPLDLMLLEKMNMRPGLPPYEWWADPPDEVKLRVYVFNVTNHERFLQGLDDKINLQEIGPIVYLEKLLHSNIRFNDNSTMTYTAKRYPIFLPQENTIDLNETVFVPNLAVLGLASYLYNAPYFVRAGFSLMVNSHGSEFFTKKTIHEYLWDFKDPVLDTSKSMVPGLVPVNNMGMLARIYSDFTDEVTVLVGPKWGHDKFFQIDRFRGEPQLPKYDPEQCPDRIFGSTEGVLYRQHLTKRDVLLYWRKTVCKLMPLYFDDEVIIDDVPAFRYNLSESVFERVTNSTDCYDTVPSLPPGLSDGSKCYFDFPMVISYPHFYTGEPPKDHYVTGLEPDKYKHNSYAIVEPNTGTPFRSVARMQSNLRVHDLSGFFGQYKTFSNSIIPLFWAEYNQEGLPSNIRSIIHFMVVILPPLTITVQVSMILLGSYLILKRMHLCNKLFDESLNTSLPFKRKKVKCLADNKVFVYEKETFIKEPKVEAS